MSEDIVIGLDGGGTRTRVIVAARDGQVQGVAERGGGSFEFNDPKTARTNLREATEAALADAGRTPDDVAAFTAGVGGLDRTEARPEVEQALCIDGLGCQPRVVTDALVAHIGAFRGDPGVVAIAGTGSMIFGRTADGDQISNFDCVHYARAGAHNLGERAVHTILAGECPDDWGRRRPLLECLDCDSVAALRTAVRNQARFTNVSSGNPFDSVAPLVTNWAVEGDDVAQDICEAAVAEVVTGVRIVGGYLDGPVGVAPAGSVLRSEYMTDALHRQLDEVDGYTFVAPAMSPVAGAVYDAVGRVADANDGAVERLATHPTGRA